MPLLADGLHNLRHALRSWAVLIHWLPTASSMSSLHLLLGLPLSRFPSLGVHSDVIFAHLVFFILATCPAHCPFMHFTFSIISITPVFDLIISFLILSLLSLVHRPGNNHIPYTITAPPRSIHPPAAYMALVQLFNHTRCFIARPSSLWGRESRTG